MIRINLIQKKQASYVSGGAGGGSKTSAFQTLGKGGMEAFLPLFQTMGIPLILSLAANFGYDFFTQQKIEEMQQEIVRFDQEKARINKELEKIKGFETVKSEIERSSLVLRTKIETIEKLIRGRDFTVKSLIYMTQAMPKDIWISEVKSTDATYEITGGTVDLSLVSDFMAKLGQTIYFKDVTLKSTATDPTGTMASFQLGAKKE